ncbi:hypothetical protein ACFWPU_01040 [Streptomyces sp. NPDC058471]|uniref:hypothetical protein n=1 Tax=Streptomyces sp. NPDC058471 TaxID=3346516 RepID=UPI00365FA769
MTWATAGSAMFTQWPRMTMGGFGSNGYANLLTDAVKVALFNNTTAPDKDAASTSTGFNTGQWVTGNEVTDSDGSSDWVTTGIALGSKTFTSNPGAAAGVLMFDAADTTHSNTVTITNAYGCLVYDDATTAGTGGVAKQGITFHYFGGAQSVTTGTFTVVWHANGLFRITV